MDRGGREAAGRGAGGVRNDPPGFVRGVELFRRARSRAMDPAAELAGRSYLGRRSPGRHCLAPLPLPSGVHPRQVVQDLSPPAVTSMAQEQWRRNLRVAIRAPRRPAAAFDDPPPRSPIRDPKSPIRLRARAGLGRRAVSQLRHRSPSSRPDPPRLTFASLRLRGKPW